MTDCHEIRELLEEFRRGQLPPEAASRVEAHLERCAACRQLREGADALVALLQGLPATPAPPALRRRVRQVAGPRLAPLRWFAAPWGAAALSALVVAAAFSAWMRWGGARAPDPVEALVASGVSEHRRILLQLEASPGELPDPAAALARVRSATEIALPRALAGTDELRLVAAQPTMLANRKAAAATLSYEAQSVTYFALPGKDLPMPAERRVQIEQYRPYMRRVDAFHVVYWKQGDLAWLMVTDLDDPHTRQVFLKMRRAL